MTPQAELISVTIEQSRELHDGMKFQFQHYNKQDEIDLETFVYLQAIDSVARDEDI